MVEDEFLVYGKVVDSNSEPIEGLWVEAYDVGIFFTNYLGHAQTNNQGHFRIIFPKQAYGYIPILNDNPSIFLRVRDEYKILHREPKAGFRLNVTEGFDNEFFIKIKLPELYSDQISHIPYRRLIRKILADSTGDKNSEPMTFEDFKKIFPALAEPIEDMIYTKEKGWKKIGYSKPQVPLRPKDKRHTDKIPWYPPDNLE